MKYECPIKQTEQPMWWIRQAGGKREIRTDRYSDTEMKVDEINCKQRVRTDSAAPTHIVYTHHCTKDLRKLENVDATLRMSISGRLPFAGKLSPRVTALSWVSSANMLRFLFDEWPPGAGKSRAGNSQKLGSCLFLLPNAMAASVMQLPRLFLVFNSPKGIRKRFAIDNLFQWLHAKLDETPIPAVSRKHERDKWSRAER